MTEYGITRMQGEKLSESYRTVKERIAAAERAYGRSAGEVLLTAAAKYAEPGEIDWLYSECGLRDFGENRVQTMLSHLEGTRNARDIRFHFIGTLQTNKVKYIIKDVYMIHSLDSVKLAREIQKQAAACGRRIKVLCEINSGREESKSGIMPEQAEQLCREISKMPALELCGFMTMAPKCENKEDYIKYFSDIYKLGLDIWSKIEHNIMEPVFSMGMTDSLEQAVACGSTCVRVGRALFGRSTADIAAKDK